MALERDLQEATGSCWGTAQALAVRIIDGAIADRHETVPLQQREAPQGHCQLPIRLPSPPPSRLRLAQSVELSRHD
jgi:hypothetical protein